MVDCGAYFRAMMALFVDRYRVLVVQMCRGGLVKDGLSIGVSTLQ
jgi:hypothetical protein